MDNKGYLELMADSLRKKITLLEQISEIDGEHKRIVSEQEFDLDGFDALVEKKGNIVDEIHKLDEGFETVYDRVREAVTGNKELYAEEIRTMQGLIGRIVELTASIEADEKRIRSDAQRQFGKLKEAVKTSRKNSRVVSNYYKTMSRLDEEPQFMDKKK